MSKSPDLIGSTDGLPGVVRELRKPALPPETGWIRVGTSDPVHGGDFAPPFVNSWGNVGGDAPPVSFYLSEHGEVRLRGAIEGGTVGTVAFTLPDGYRPEYSMRFVGALSIGNDIATIQVDPDGKVWIIGAGWSPGTGTVSPTVLAGGSEGEYLKWVDGEAVWAAIPGTTPGNVVISETSFGQSADAGDNTTYSRSDHTHGTPADPMPEHIAASDPHTQYQKESEKAAASGYASLDVTTKVPVAQLGTGTADDSVVLFGDRVWREVADLGAAGAGSTVESETAFGQSPDVGSSGNFAREDHTHGTPTDPIPAHVAQSDPHTQYQKESEKNVANGYAGLEANGRVAISRLASGTPDGTKFIRDDGTLATPAGGGGGGSETPGDTVESETTFGLSPDAGIGAAFSRVDHTHGTPVDPIPAHLAETNPHSQYVLLTQGGEPGGFLPLDETTGLAPVALLGGNVGDPTGFRFLRDDGEWVELISSGFAGLAVREDGTLVATRLAFNFHAGDGVVLDIEDDGVNAEVDITIGLDETQLSIKNILLEWEDEGPATSDLGTVLIVPQINGVDVSFELTEMKLRAETPGSTQTQVKLQHSEGGDSAFTPLDLATFTLPATDYQVTSSGSYGTVTSGDLLRIRWQSVGTGAANFFLMIQGTEV